MAESNRYQIGNVGPNAVVQQGEYLYHIEVKVENVEDVNALLERLRQAGRPPYRGPVLRHLDPLVFLNRADELEEIRQFLERGESSVLYVVGLPAIGKSTLVRGALELRREDVPVVWITCEGLTADSFFNEVCLGLGVNLDAVMKDPAARVAAKVEALLQGAVRSAILVLDGFEALLTQDGRFDSQSMQQIVDSLTTLDHKLKTLVTTRTVPAGAARNVLRLRGVSQEQAVKLFEDRAGLDAGQVVGLFPEEVWAKLEGHPKFIELLAAAVEEVPVKEIREGLVTATDIGDFVLEQVVSRTSEEELQILTALLVFRWEASYDALVSVHGELYGEGAAMTKPLKRLVRRNVLEPVGDAQVSGYYLHQMLRDAVPRTKEAETRAHYAAAGWFAANRLDEAKVATYDDVLYHLRQAASIIPSAEHCLIYQKYLQKHRNRLSFGGWSRRLIEELSTLLGLLRQFEGEEFDTFRVRWMIGLEYWQLHRYDSAVPILRELIEECEEKYSQVPDERKQDLDEWLLVIKAKLGNSYVHQGKLDEALALAREIEPLANATEVTDYKLRHRELCFDIARKTRDVEQMSYWGEESFKLAEKLAREEPSPQNTDALAEAHFLLGVVNIWKKNMDEVYRHLVAQLRLKLEIRKLAGVGAGLFNLGSLMSTTYPAEGAAMLLTAREIKEVVGEAETDDYSDLFAEMDRVLQEPGNAETGREALGQISEELLPYFDAALARWKKELASLPPPPPAQPPETPGA